MRQVRPRSKLGIGIETLPLVNNKDMDFTIDKSILQPIDRFRRYEEEFLNSYRIVSQSVRQLELAHGNLETILSNTVDIEGELIESEAYLRAMDVEFRAMVSTEKKTISERVSQHKESYSQLVSHFKLTRQAAESYALKATSSKRPDLSTLNEKLDSSTASLEESRKIVAETENIGNVIISTMSSQKEQLLAASDNVQNTKKITIDTKALLNRMGTRAFIHQSFLVFVMLILFILICMVIHYGFFRRWSY